MTERDAGGLGDGVLSLWAVSCFVGDWRRAKRGSLDCARDDRGDALEDRRAGDDKRSGIMTEGSGITEGKRRRTGARGRRQGHAGGDRGAREDGGTQVAGATLPLLPP